MEIEKTYIATASCHFLIEEGLRSLIDGNGKYGFAGSATNLAELDKILKTSQVKLIISCIYEKGNDKIAQLQQFLIGFPQVSLLVITTPMDKSQIHEWMKAGIKNIIYFSAEKEEMLTAIDIALKGKKYFTPEILELFMESASEKSKATTGVRLTASETEIVRLISNGLTNKEIASKKHISVHTVNTHRKNIFRKLEVNNTSELLMYSIKAGWIENIEYYI